MNDANEEPTTIICCKCATRPLITFYETLHHFLAMIAIIGTMAALHKFTELTVGPEKKLLDLVPLEYFPQIGDLIAFTRFIWMSLKSFNRE